MRLALAQLGRRKAPQREQAVGAAAALQLVERRQLVGPAGHDHLAAALVRHAVLGAEAEHEFAARAHSAALREPGL